LEVVVEVFVVPQLILLTPVVVVVVLLVLVFSYIRIP
jgi:hypothetical protein